MGDLPLRTPKDRRRGGPSPRRLPNPTHPHPMAASLSSKSDAFFGQHRGLIRLSPGCPRPWGRLDTRYSPVRRSPSKFASKLHAAPRLACVKPVASVHPEPGSNSPLYNLCISSNTHRSGRGGLSLNRTPRVRSSFLIYYGLGIDGPASSITSPTRGPGRRPDSDINPQAETHDEAEPLLVLLLCLM